MPLAKRPRSVTDTIMVPDEADPPRLTRLETAIVMNPNYREENFKLLSQAGLSVHLIDQI